jgi:hypothetical protein
MASIMEQGNIYVLPKNIHHLKINVHDLQKSSCILIQEYKKIS